MPSKPSPEAMAWLTHHAETDKDSPLGRYCRSILAALREQEKDRKQGELDYCALMERHDALRNEKCALAAKVRELEEEAYMTWGDGYATGYERGYEDA